MYNLNIVSENKNNSENDSKNCKESINKNREQ